MAIERLTTERLTKKERNMLWNRYMWFNNGCTNFQNFYGNGWAWVLRPLFEKYYNKEGVIDGMSNQLDWYNCEAQSASVIAGVVVGMEEERAVTGKVNQDVIRATKASLQGPVAGIGDSVVQGTIIPLLLGIGISLTQSTGALGPIFYIVSYLAVIVFGSYFLFNQGYKLGRSAMSNLTGGAFNKLLEAFMLFGTIVVGALGANYVKPTTALQWASGDSVTSLQTVIDGIFPKLLSLGVIFLCYWLVKKKNVSLVKMILGMLLIVIAGTYIGIF